jgi:hypothetical protein
VGELSAACFTCQCALHRAVPCPVVTCCHALADCTWH